MAERMPRTEFSPKEHLPKAFRIPYGSEMLSYIIDFIVKTEGKERPDAVSWRAHSLAEPAQPRTAEEQAALDKKVSPQECVAILNEIKSIFSEENKYLSPFEIERKLIERRGAALAKKFLDIAEGFAAVDRQPEAMTNFLIQKSFAGLVVAQASLYGTATNTRVTVFDADASNMRGTNDLYYWLLCMERGVEWTADGPRDPALMAEAERLTDRAARIVLAIARDETGGGALRTGGDEFRFLRFGAMERGGEDSLIAVIHERSEDATGRMGLHDHPHAKPTYRNDPVRRGFGNALGWFWLPDDDINFAEGANQAEAETENAKLDLGRARLARRERDPAYAALRERFFERPGSEEDRAELQTLASAYLEKSIGAMEALEAELKIGPPPAPEKRPAPNLHRLGELAGKAGLDTLPDDDALRKLVAGAFRESLTAEEKESFKNMDDRERRLVEALAAHAPARDYATGSYAGSDFPALAGIVSSVNESLRARALAELPSEHPDRAALEKRGVFVVGASLNPAGMNAIIKHEATNKVLEHFAGSVLGEALAAAGLTPENACVLHLGGGDFAMMLQGAIPQGGGEWRIVNAHDVKKIETAILQEVAKLNNTPCATLLKGLFNSASLGGDVLFRNIPDARVEGATGLRSTAAGLWVKVGDHKNPGGLVAGRFREEFDRQKTAAAPVPASAPTQALAPFAAP